MVKRKSIVWGNIAKIQLKKICQFYYDNTGNVDFCRKLNSEINHTLFLVSENNLLGKSIPKTKLRSVIVYSYAIIYEVKENHIYVSMIWDTRRDPVILKILLQELF